MTKKDTKIIETFNAPKLSDDLADRIIMQARQTEQKVSLTDHLKTIFYGFQTPALSYGFASIFVAALLIGGIMYSQAPSNDYSVDYAMDDLFGEDDDLLIL